ncbi:hypothetical protein PPL_10111 [Heterostelium album PN500]|uniref:SD-repeat containing protein B domain-containing protein n=1 Tax=Heterostelium pallidum (strain ATCC 26659 / Pp 5 / PN500) TaxID=670386 RepID=D3BQC6_HETP5|nr:hypothetical protein PPL_10111 [Heterostelium album PN500]EFA76346.1 hypothetical protein PPL_10111 [Heterostelium album PN500]|eukprot:XP_020428478.1 hypothetical protein PPL_10111 [Heterostelium album PN500]
MNLAVHYQCKNAVIIRSIFIKFLKNKKMHTKTVCLMALLFMFVSSSWSLRFNERFEKAVICLCDNTTMSYYDFSNVKPALSDPRSYYLEMNDTKVIVKVTGANLPLVVGSKIPYKAVLDNNHKYFDFTGRQDINVLLHQSCSQSPSNVTFDFLTPMNDTFLVLFGISDSDLLQMNAWDAYGMPINLLNWNTIDHGFLHPSGMNAAFLSNQAVGGKGSLMFNGTSSNVKSYVIVKPNISVSKITFTLSSVCQPPSCMGLNMMYAFIKGKCIDTTTPTPSPTRSPTPTPSPPPLHRYALNGTFYYDRNENGRQDPEDLPISNMQVMATRASDGRQITVVTNNNGVYTHRGLPDGTYILGPRMSQGVMSTVKTGPNGNILNPATAMSDPVVLTNTTAGLITLSENSFLLNGLNGAIKIQKLGIMGVVCTDKDGDGKMTPILDNGIDGITVELYDQNNKLINTTETRSVGRWMFDNVPLGKYSVQIKVPDGMKSTSTDYPTGKISNIDANKQNPQSVAVPQGLGWESDIAMGPYTVCLQVIHI